jgi:hypothetical protein
MIESRYQWILDIDCNTYITERLDQLGPLLGHDTPYPYAFGRLSVNFRQAQEAIRQLQAELERCQAEIANTNMKAAHGCYDFFCPECDARNETK